MKTTTNTNNGSGFYTNGRCKTACELEKEYILDEISSALLVSGSFLLPEKIRLGEMSAKADKRFRKQLLSITPLLTSENCRNLKQIKDRKGYDVEFRVTRGGIFVNYFPQLEREDMESAGFVMRSITPVYDALSQIFKAN